VPSILSAPEMIAIAAAGGSASAADSHDASAMQHSGATGKWAGACAGLNRTGWGPIVLLVGAQCPVMRPS
jgi:hypothetical protein